MSSYSATVRWDRTAGDVFTDGRYSRAHRWSFDGGTEVPASPSPHIVPPPMSDPAGVDPEEAFIASLSSCHMLFFLDFARRAGLVVDTYLDEASGELGKDSEGRTAMTRVALHPRISWAGEAPQPEQLAELHHRAHEACFIANSVKTSVIIA